MSGREYLPSGDELRARRVALGLSQMEVGRRLGKTGSHVGYIEREYNVGYRSQQAYIALLDELEHATT